MATVARLPGRVCPMDGEKQKAGLSMAIIAAGCTGGLLNGGDWGANHHALADTNVPMETDGGARCFARVPFHLECDG